MKTAIILFLLFMLFYAFTANTLKTGIYVFALKFILLILETKM